MCQLEVTNRRHIEGDPSRFVDAEPVPFSRAQPEWIFHELLCQHSR